MEATLKQWAFYPGWAMDPAAFVPLARRLGGKSWFFDRGYTGNPSTPAPETGRWNIVTHSMGLWHVPFDLLVSCESIFILGGFDVFIPEHSRGKKMVSRYINNLRRGLVGSPQKTLGQFHQLCGLPPEFCPAPGSWDIPLLTADLARLETEHWDGHRFLKDPVLFHGDQDQVVLNSQGSKLGEKLGCSVKWLPQTGHGCKIDQPDELTDLMQQAQTR